MNWALISLIGLVAVIALSNWKKINVGVVGRGADRHLRHPCIWLSPSGFPGKNKARRPPLICSLSLSTLICSL